MLPKVTHAASSPSALGIDNSASPASSGETPSLNPSKTPARFASFRTAVASGASKIARAGSFLIERGSVPTHSAPAKPLSERRVEQMPLAPQPEAGQAGATSFAKARLRISGSRGEVVAGGARMNAGIDAQKSSPTGKHLRASHEAKGIPFAASVAIQALGARNAKAASEAAIKSGLSTPEASESFGAGVARAQQTYASIKAAEGLSVQEAAAVTTAMAGGASKEEAIAQLRSGALRTEADPFPFASTFQHGALATGTFIQQQASDFDAMMAEFEEPKP
jgi:hypothetical protein